jgi:hypothetical protein
VDDATDVDAGLAWVAAPYTYDFDIHSLKESLQALDIKVYKERGREREDDEEVHEVSTYDTLTDDRPSDSATSLTRTMTRAVVLATPGRRAASWADAPLATSLPRAPSSSSTLLSHAHASSARARTDTP